MKLKVQRTLRAFTLKNRTTDVEVTQKHRGKGKGKITDTCVCVCAHGRACWVGEGRVDCNFTTRS